MFTHALWYLSSAASALQWLLLFSHWRPLWCGLGRAQATRWIHYIKWGALACAKTHVATSSPSSQQNSVASQETWRVFLCTSIAVQPCERWFVRIILLGNKYETSDLWYGIQIVCMTLFTQCEEIIDFLYQWKNGHTKIQHSLRKGGQDSNR